MSIRQNIEHRLSYYQCATRRCSAFTFNTIGMHIVPPPTPVWDPDPSPFFATPREHGLVLDLQDVHSRIVRRPIDPCVQRRKEHVAVELGEGKVEDDMAVDDGKSRFFECAVSCGFTHWPVGRAR